MFCTPQDISLPGASGGDMLEKGQTVNKRYEIVNLIAKGGTSCVYLVLDKHIGRMLAMKAMERSAVGAFYFARSEIEALRRVRYPLIPAIWDAFYDSRNIYIVSEYVKGDSLGTLCKAQGMGRAQSLMIAQHICSALLYLHGMKQPMLYLDLKPDNIIIDEEGLPHLVDFGIAGCLAGHHIPVGTIGYSPPEQYDKNASLDARADVFALGMTYYAIRSGNIPDPDPEEAIRDIKHSKILSQSEKSFLVKCCSLSKEERYSGAYEVLKQIRHIRSIPQKIKKSIEITITAAGVLVLSYCATARIHGYIKEKGAAKLLYEKTAECMKDGEYTPEGIRLIRSAIASNVLPEDCEQDFIFEVAANSMFVEHDYKTAALYFSKLDPHEYPDANDYINLCNMQNRFDFERGEAADITGRLFGATLKRRPSKQKYETLIFIAGCYENYEYDEAEGLSKSIAVIGTAREEIAGESAKSLSVTEDEYKGLCSRLDELLEVKEARMKIIYKQTRREKNGEKDNNT